MKPGDCLGPYEVLVELGEGGMGEVYKARDTRLDRTVAIKVLPAQLSADPDRRARFEREAKTIAALKKKKKYFSPRILHPSQSCAYGLIVVI